VKLTHIEIQNVLGIRRAVVRLDKPICLFAGPNHHGKSSMAEAIRMALTGDATARGVHLKKDLSALVHDGCESGSAAVQFDRVTAYVVLPSGKTTPVAEYAMPPALPYVLDGQRFSTLAPNDRRSFLFGLMGIKITPEAVTQRLVAKGLVLDKIKRITPLLRGGFDAAHKEAKAKATEAKGAWRAITGETYGAVKAASWAAAVPAYDAAALEDALARLSASDAAIATANQTLGALQGDKQRYDAQRARLPALSEKAARLDRIKAKLVKDEADLAEWQAKVDSAGGKPPARPPAVLTCPCCDASLTQLPNGALQAYRGPEVDPDEDPAPEAEPGLNFGVHRASRDLMASAVTNGKRDLADAVAASADLKAIKALGEPPAQSEINTAAVGIEQLKTARQVYSAKVDAMRQAKAAAEAAAKRTTEAAAHHVDVVAWDKLGDALAPDGIPGEMLVEALEPINSRLQQSANDSEWLTVGINADMSITWGTRPYAMLAEAISFHSGVKLLVLDRFDLLDLQGRADLLAWLEVLVEQGEVDSALLFGTLKALPATLPACAQAEWIEGGVVGAMRAAA